MPDPTLNYAPPATESRRRTFSWRAFSCVLAGTLLCGATFWYTTATMEPVLTDFKIELPYPTQLLLFASRWLGKIGDCAIIVALPIIGGFLFARLPRPSRDAILRHERLIRALTAAIFTLAFCTFFTLTVIVLFLLPMVSLIRGMSPSPSSR